MRDWMYDDSYLAPLSREGFLRSEMTTDRLKKKGNEPVEREVYYFSNDRQENRSTLFQKVGRKWVKL